MVNGGFCCNVIDDYGDGWWNENVECVIGGDGFCGNIIWIIVFVYFWDVYFVDGCIGCWVGVGYGSKQCVGFQVGNNQFVWYLGQLVFQCFIQVCFSVGGGDGCVYDDEYWD